MPHLRPRRRLAHTGLFKFVPAVNLVIWSVFLKTRVRNEHPHRDLSGVFLKVCCLHETTVLSKPVVSKCTVICTVLVDPTGERNAPAGPSKFACVGDARFVRYAAVGGGIRQWNGKVFTAQRPGAPA